MSAFDEAFKKTLGHEGKSLSNSAYDFGGETFWGISRVKHPNWRGWKLIDAGDRGSFELQAAAKEFYLNEFWYPLLCHYIENQRVVNKLFDAAVNVGRGNAVKFLQTALNKLNRNQKLYPDLVVDGVIGKKTLGILNGFTKPNRNDIEMEIHLLLFIMTVERGHYYVELMDKSPTQEYNARGWMKRISIED